MSQPFTGSTEVLNRWIQSHTHHAATSLFSSTTMPTCSACLQLKVSASHIVNLTVRERWWCSGEHSCLPSS